MKQQCDNRCETCPTQSQLYCVLMFVKANNSSIGALAERIEAIESNLSKEETSSPTYINPILPTDTPISILSEE